MDEKPDAAGAGEAAAKPRRISTGCLVALALLLVFLGAIAVPNLLNAIQRGKQRRTLSDLRTVGTALESYRVDYGFLPRVGSGTVEEKLRAVLEPTFAKLLPTVDAWRQPIQVVSSGDAYSIVSLGKDREPDRVVALGVTTDPGADIYFSDGQFTGYPESDG